MPPVAKKSSRTSFERLVEASIGVLLNQRKMFSQHVKKWHGLKPEEGVVLTYVRLSLSQGRVITATSLSADILVPRRTVADILQRLVRKGLVTTREKHGKETVYENPEGYSYPHYLLDDILVAIVARQILRGEQMKKLVSELDDPRLKQLIDDTISDVAKTAAFGIDAA
jgi:predicted transcriptional regulator